MKDEAPNESRNDLLHLRPARNFEPALERVMAGHKAGHKMTVHKEGIHRRMMDFDLLDDSVTTSNESDATEVAVRPFTTAKTASDHSHPLAGLHCQLAEWFVVRVRRELGAQNVAALVRYLTDFGSGDARGVAVEGGWSIHLTKLADLRLVTAQYPDLIEHHSVSCKSGVKNGQPLAF